MEGRKLPLSLAVAAFLVIAAAPAASGGGATCSEQTMEVQPGTYVIVDTNPSPACGDAIEIWQECNGVTGVQRDASHGAPDCQEFPPWWAVPEIFGASCAQAIVQVSDSHYLFVDSAPLDGCHAPVELWEECNGITGIQRSGPAPDCRHV